MKIIVDTPLRRCNLYTWQGNKALSKTENKGNMMTTYTVELKDGTVGTICDSTLDGQSAEAFIGEMVNVHLHDENGMQIEAQGVLVSVLESN